MIKIKIITVVIMIIFPGLTFSQIGFGTTGGIDFYQRYTNPDDGIAYPSAGNVLLNFVFGPKIWVGNKNVSLSVEMPFNLGMTTLAIKDFKGMGSFAVPVIGKLNFSALSGFYPAFGKGMSVGAGIQWTRTELLLLRRYKEKNVKRKFFKTYVLEIDFGYGSFGTAGYVYVRAGKSFRSGAKILNIGVLVSINSTYTKKNVEYIINRKSR